MVLRGFAKSLRRRVLPILLLGILKTCAADDSPEPCEVVVKSYLLYADPSYMTGTHEPTATPVPHTFMGLVDINVKSTGSSSIAVSALRAVVQNPRQILVRSRNVVD
jgi:hypothetical protein